MDVLRSAHETKARVGSDNETEATLRWYRCAEGAKAYPGWHAFGNPVWEPFKDEWTEGPGVIDPPLKWVPSVIDAPPGTEFHGKKEWFEKGIPQSILDNPEPHKTPPCIPEVVGIDVGVRVGVSLLDLRVCRVRVGGPLTFEFPVFGD